MSKELPRIIEWEKTAEDAQKLANCYNKWDDDDSWPGGFNQGVKFTTERILERPAAPVIAYVAAHDDEFVGYIDVYRHRDDKDALYVGLLGVSPEFQGQGYGRDLLKKVTGFAARTPGISHLELGTWAGNTKSVPTYKKTGYKWVPGSDNAILENYLPLILNFAPFSEFFAASDYYVTMNMEIKQQPDIEQFENMTVFIYRFENDGGEKTTTIIDRYSKNITGFTIGKHDGEVGAWCLLSSHEGFAGYGNTTVTWRFKNTSQHPLSVKLSARGMGGVILEPIEDLAMVIPAGETVEKRAEIQLESSINVRKIAQENNPKAETLIISDIRINETAFQFKTAQLPLKPFKIASFPEIPTITDNILSEHELQLTNTTSDSLKMKIRIPPIPGFKIALLSPESAALEPNSSTYLKLQMQATTDQGAGILRVPLQLDLTESGIAEGQIFQEQFQAFHSRNYQVHGYCNSDEPTNDPLFLQNSFLRVNFRNKPPYDILRFDNLMSGHFTGFFGPNIDLGPPYEGFLNEWQKPDKDYELEMKEDPSKAAFLFRAKSSRFPVMLEREITMYAGFPGLELSYRLTNLAEKEARIHLKTDFGLTDVFNEYHICPLKSGLTVFNTGQPNYPQKIKAPSQFFAENWFSSTFSTGTTMGVIWEESAQALTQMELHQGSTQFRWEDLVIPPGNNVTLGCKMMMIEGNWDMIRGNWMKECGRTIKGPHHKGLFPRESVKMSIHTNSFHQGLLNNAIKELGVRITTSGEHAIVGTLQFKLAGSNTLKAIDTTFPVEGLTREQPYEASIPVTLQEHPKQEILTGSLMLQTRYLDILKSFQLLSFPQKTIDVVGPESVGEEKQYSIDNGNLFFQANTHGSIHFLNRVSNAKNLLEARFPERDATFVFFNPFTGGIQPLVKFFGPREDAVLSQEQAKFQMEEVLLEGANPWQGVRACYTTTSYHPGIGLTVEHLTLPGVSFIKSIITLENHKDEFLLLRFGFFAFLTAEGGKPPKVELFDRQGQLVQRLADQFTKLPRTVPCIQITTIDPETKLGFIVDGSLHGLIDYLPAGDKMRIIRVYTGHKIEPHGKATIALYTVLLKANEEVTDYLLLREDDTAKYPENGADCLEIMDFPVFY
ncbi:MAG: GNAT family N-acetyltransferase [Candidatus Hodarchaeales archaeon]|jgi:GNAT superfamily N-acetyltransferase